MFGGGLELNALRFVLIAIVAAAVLRPRVKGETLTWRILIYWAGAATIMCVLASPPVRFILLGILSLALTPKQAEERPAYYLGILMAIPLGAFWLVPFPGAAYLYQLHHTLLLAFTVLIPALFVPVDRKGVSVGPAPTGTYWFVIVLACFAAILETRGDHASLTNILRVITLQLTMVALPFFVFQRLMVTRAAWESVLRVLVLVGAIFTIGGLLSIATHFNPWLVMNDTNANMASLYRAGDVRVALTTNPTFAAFLMLVFAAVLWKTRKMVTTPAIVSYLWIAAALLVLVGTGSRGGILAALVFGFLIVAAWMQSWALRVGWVTLGAIGGAVLYMMLAATGFSSVDEYGTFDYRARLLEEGLAHIRDYPFFGQPGFADNPRFEPLRQGQGIIDFVNTYLLLALTYGLVGLVLNVILFGRAGLGFVRGADRMRRRFGSDDPLTGIGSGMAALYGGFLVLIITVSPIDYIQPVIYLFIALGLAYSRMTRALALAPDVAPDVASENVLEGTKTSSSGLGAGTTPPTPDLMGQDKNGRGKNGPGSKSPLPSAPKTPVFDVSPGPKGWPS